jgi:hypothetical protein
VQGAFIIGSYIAFEVTEAIHWSGIIASLFCGFAMRHYAIKNIAEQYQPMVIDMVHMLALMADLCIFFSVGTNIVLQVRSTPSFFLHHGILKSRTFYQDRLGTNIGKALKKSPFSRSRTSSTQRSGSF